MLPPRARAIFWNMRIKIDVWIWGRFFILGRFSLEVSSKMECARTRFLRQSNSLELCPDWPEKRPSKSIYKTNEILTFWLQRPSDVAIRVSRSCFFFLLKWCKSTSENPFSEGEAYFWRCHNAFGATLTDVSWKMHVFFYGNFSRIDKIARGFPSQVDFRKSSHFMFKLSMLQKAPKRRSPNTAERRSKWA